MIIGPKENFDKFHALKVFPDKDYGVRFDFLEVYTSFFLNVFIFKLKMVYLLGLVMSGELGVFFLIEGFELNF